VAPRQERGAANAEEKTKFESELKFKNAEDSKSKDVLKDEMRA